MVSSVVKSLQNDGVYNNQALDNRFRVKKKHKFINEGQKPFIIPFQKKAILLLCPVGVLCLMPRLSDCKLGSLLQICCNLARRRKCLSLATGKLGPQYDLGYISNKISVSFLVTFIYIKILVYRINHGLDTEVFSVFNAIFAGNNVVESKVTV